MISKAAIVRVNLIGIVGVGPRGLTILERIVAHERHQSSGPLEVLLFDPREPGSGCHAPEQSNFHLVNTVAGQLTLFSDATVVGGGPVMGGPTFFEWLRAQSHMHNGGALAGAALGAAAGGADAAAADADAYYARGLFGRYLQWVFRYVCALAPRHVSIKFIQSAIDRVQRDVNGAWVLHAAGQQVRVDHLFLTTGHTKPASQTARLTVSPTSPAQTTLVVHDPYPMHVQLCKASAGMTVAVEGMGLTAMDVVAELTLGRGGRFVTADTAGSGNTRVYIPSGHEPRIVLFSRSGLPLSARAVNQKGVSGQYRAHFLRMSHLRELRVYRKLDFVQDVLPLLVADMEYAYYQAYLRQLHGAGMAAQFCEQFAAADPLHRRALISDHVPTRDHFSWDALVQPVPAPALQGRAAFAAWLTGHLQHDLREAQRGNLDSPLKAACDVLRDLRDTLRAAIEFGGLTAASHRWVLSEFMPIMNRLAVGPPAARISEMLALMKAGVLVADFGPGATCGPVAQSPLMQVSATHWGGHALPVHLLVKARISMHSPGADASPLLQGLLQDGHVRLFQNDGFHPGGIEVDRHHRWVGRNGHPVPNAWSLGIPTEGVKFCTFVIPRSGVNSSAMADAGRAVAQMLSLLRKDPSQRPSGPPPELPSEEQALVTASQFGGL